MKSSLALLSALLLAPLSALHAAPPRSGADEVQGTADFEAAAEWSREFWEAVDPAKVPIVFDLGEKSSREVLANWEAAPVQKVTKGEITRRTFRWTDAISGLELHVDVTSYRQWPVVEWTGWLRNTGRHTSPVVENLLAADMRFSGEGFTLHGIEGDDCSEKSYRPYAWTPQPGVSRRFGGQGGKSSGGEGWPYFNLAGSGPNGRMLAVGWPAQWSAEFIGETSGMRVKAGQELTRFQLEPGEQVRLPSVTMLFWKGSDWILSQNLWRRWYREHVMPRTGGELQKAVVQVQASPTESSVTNIQALLAHGVKPDLCWPRHTRNGCCRAGLTALLSTSEIPPRSPG